MSLSGFFVKARAKRRCRRGAAVITAGDVLAGQDGSAANRRKPFARRHFASFKRRFCETLSLDETRLFQYNKILNLT